jgi:hypothetical protein
VCKLHLVPSLQDVVRLAVVNCVGGEIADPRVVVLVVVVGEETDAEFLRLIEACEAARKRRTMLERLEKSLGIRVVVAYRGTPKRLGAFKQTTPKSHRILR